MDVCPHEQSFALVIKVNKDTCHTSSQFEFDCCNCESFILERDHVNIKNNNLLCQLKL